MIKIISYLSKQNPNLTRFDPYILAKIGYPQYGYLEFSSQNLTKIDLFYELVSAKPIMVDITLIPGETTIIFLQELAKKEKLNFLDLEGEYNKTAPFYEGFLIPETYKISKGESAINIIKYMVKESQKKHEALSKKLLGEFNITKWQEIIIIASIVQKEAADIYEMSTVASVIYNRLVKNMKLQMDGTLNYGEYSHIKVTPQRIKNDLSKYNTYIYEGLPPQAICAVSQEAINAAINPAKTEFLYFVLDRKTGKHMFSKTHSEHIRNIQSQR